MSVKDKRLSTPLVLVAVSAMVCIGLVGMLLANDDAPEPSPEEPTEIIVDASTPERAAESFLDAWRKRAHAAAEGLAVDDALEEVQARSARDARMSDHERELKAQVWDAMARDRLRLLLSEAENLEGGRLRLAGTAEGSFLGHPYSRAMEFVMRPEGEEWRVETFTFGEILSDVPGALDLDDG